MRTRLDHVVTIVESLADAVAAFRAAGFTVLPGGRHDVLPTENALIVFADGTYVELLALCERGARTELVALRASARWEAHLHGASAIGRRFLPRLAGSAGVGDACVTGERLARFAAESRRRDVVMTGPVPMRRAVTGGGALAWDLLLPASGTLPFLIEDRTPRAARVPGTPEAVGHANGARGIAAVRVRCAAPAASALQLADLFEAQLDARPDGATVATYAGTAWRLEPGAPEGACGIVLEGVAELPPAITALGIAPGGAA